MKIVDAAVVDRGRLGRISVHQTTDRGALKSGVRIGTLGVIAGAIVAGPAGAVAMGAAGGVLGGLRGGIHDTGIDDKFMRSVGKEIEKKKSALFVLYEGSWEHSIGLVEQAITDEHAVLFNSTLHGREGRGAAGPRGPRRRGGGRRRGRRGLRARGRRGARGGCRGGPAPVEEAAAVAAVAAAPAEAKADDLTQLVGIGPKASAALAAAGITTYAALSEHQRAAAAARAARCRHGAARQRAGRGPCRPALRPRATGRA